MNLSLPVDCVLFLGSEVRVETRHVERIVATWKALFVEHRGAGWPAPIVGALFPGEPGTLCGGLRSIPWAVGDPLVRVGAEDRPLSLAIASGDVARVVTLNCGSLILAPRNAFADIREPIDSTSRPYVYADLSLDVARRDDGRTLREFARKA